MLHHKSPISSKRLDKIILYKCIVLIFPSFHFISKVPSIEIIASIGSNLIFDTVSITAELFTSLGIMVRLSVKITVTISSIFFMGCYTAAASSFCTISLIKSPGVLCMAYAFSLKYSAIALSTRTIGIRILAFKGSTFGGLFV